MNNTIKNLREKKMLALSKNRFQPATITPCVLFVYSMLYMLLYYNYYYYAVSTQRIDLKIV